MSADRFEQRVADWLEDGPEVGPASIADAVLVHARRHPRSRVRTLAVRARRFAPALAAAAVVVMLAGTSVGALSLFRSPSTPVASVQVTAAQICTNPVPGARLSPQAGSEADELRGRIDRCTETSSDPRVSGELTRRMDATLFVPISSWYGTFELRNQRGAWTGALVGTFQDPEPVRDGRMTWVAVGSGAYDGLVYRATALSDANGLTTVVGTIEGIDGDGVVASTWCWVVTADPDLSEGESPPHRTATRSCLVAASDERVAGSADETRTIDVAGDGSTRDTGTLSLRTASGGTWSGSFEGSGSWWIPGQVTGTAAGSGALAGQRLSFRIASEDGMRGILLGTISPAP